MATKTIVITVIGAVLWAVVISAVWSGVANVIAARYDVTLPPTASNEGATAAQAPMPIKAEPPPRAPQTVPPPSQLPRIMPPWPAPPDGGVWKETFKEECELLPDREEARLCVQYPLRESILNSLVLGHPVRSIVGVRYKVPQSCPIIPAGEARAIVCGKLAEQYELYCCK